MTKIKICGLTRPQDIAYVNEARPDFIGFILLFPKSRRNLTPEQAAALRNELDPGIRTVGVFVNQTAETVLAAAKLINLDVIQLHGQEDAAYIRKMQRKHYKKRSLCSYSEFGRNDRNRSCVRSRCHRG